MACELISRSCPLCGGDELERVLKISYASYGLTNANYMQDRAEPLRRLDAEVNPSVCAQCGFLYVRRVPGDDLGRYLYEEVIDWRKSLDKTHGPAKKAARAYIVDVMRRMVDAFGLTGRRVLDMGCGWGDLLLDLSAEGWRAVGVELSERRFAHAASRGATVYKTLAEALRSGSFDAVMAIQYLEHDPFFPKTLRLLHDTLKPGGVGYVCVPCADLLFDYHDGCPSLPESPSGDINPFEHVNYFRITDFIRALQKAGFQVLDPDTLKPASVLKGTYCAIRKAGEEET